MDPINLLRPAGLVDSPAFSHVAVIPPGATTILGVWWSACSPATLSRAVLPACGRLIHPGISGPCGTDGLLAAFSDQDGDSEMTTVDPVAGGDKRATDPAQEAAGPTGDASLSRFVARFEPRLRNALLAWAGPHDVDDAVAETLLHLMGQPHRVLAMANPEGYLYRVARSKLRGSRRRHPVLPPVPPVLQPEVEPGLPAALAALTPRQRTAVFLMGGLGWTAAEVGEFLGIAPTSVHNHYQRGLARLRRDLGEVTS